MTQETLIGLEPLSKAGFVNGRPNAFLETLLGKIDWMTSHGRDYQQSLRDVAGLDAKIASARNVYRTANTPESRQDYRRALRDRDLATRGWAEIEIDFFHLPVPDQRAIKILIDEAVPRVERIYAAQMDPENLKYWEEIIERGDPEDLYAFRNMGGVHCLSSKMDPLCSSHPDSPEPVTHQGFWPSDMDDEAITEACRAPLSTAPNVAELGSSFVFRQYAPGSRTLVARSLNAYPPIQEDLKALVTALRRAGSVEGLEPLMARFLQTRANEFMDTQNPWPFFSGDVDWINMQGAWDMTLGFDDETHSPLETVAIIEMILGIVDLKREEQGRNFQTLLPWMEDRYAAALGPDYRKRNFEGVAPLRFVDALHAGDANARYIPAAFNLPNVPPYGRRDLSKKVLLLKSSEARFSGVILPMARITMYPEQLARLQKNDGLSFIIGHENAHAAGPGPFHIVRKEAGQDIMARTLLREHAGALEEARADMLGMASLAEAVRRGLISQDEAEREAICFVASLMRGLALGKEDAHGKGAFVEFTTLFEMGAIIETPGGRYAANLEDDRLFGACEEIGNRINRIQMQGDYQGYDNWYRHSVEQLPDTMRSKYLPILQNMPKDFFPQYSFRFSEVV